VSICQNDKFEFSFLQNTYLGLSQALTSTASTLGFWYIQKYWKISTKKMASEFRDTSNVTVVSLIALVCCHECVYNPHSILGHVGYLDRKDWVHLVFFPFLYISVY